MLRRFISILLIAMLCAVSGCAEEPQTRTMMFIEALGIDIRNGKYIVTAQVFDAMHNGGGLAEQSMPVTHVVDGEGVTISEAVECMSLYTGKDAVYTTNKLTVLGEAVAQEKLAEVVDYLLRHNESRSAVSVVVARGTAEDIVRSTMNGSLRPGLDMLHIILKSQQRETYGRDSERYRALDIINAFNDNGINLSLLAVTLKTKDMLAERESGTQEPSPGSDETHMQVDGIAYFDQSGLSGYLTGDAYDGYMWLTGSRVYNMATANSGETGLMTFESLSKHVDIHFDVTGEQPRIEIIITGTAGLMEVEKSTSLVIDDAFLIRAEQAYNAAIFDKCSAAIVQAQAAGCDIFGLGQRLRFWHPQYWQGMGDRWPEIFNGCEVTIGVDMRVNRVGELVGR